ncbi:putative metalloprotease CJM1_0395 family protein [Methylomarinovum tepidoasis]|uniref:putative metalloprotease CJM1_0395 family protein n=1 Tax=Methylomarinovum tepidoasis TaxID=2840183 RepID=UPI00257228A7|nr:putative metalloprotease CJM1_0395 family protein [Methylomarinovum sp. IN45]
MQVPSASQAFLPHVQVAGSPVAGRGAESEGKAKAAVTDRLQLDQAQLRQVERLRQRDREVRAHEMAHLAAAGSYALGGPSFEYQVGPDGQRYAIGGHINIDTSPVPSDPEATLRKAETIRRAALAPGDPSPQDRSVAAAAAAMAMKAQIEIQQRQDGGDNPLRRNAGQEADISAYGHVRVTDAEASLELDLYG